jgi:hypothetical protein
VGGGNPTRPLMMVGWPSVILTLGPLLGCLLELVEVHDGSLLAKVVNSTNDRHQTPLMLASGPGHGLTVQLLLLKVRVCLRLLACMRDLVLPPIFTQEPHSSDQRATLLESKIHVCFPSLSTSAEWNLLQGANIWCMDTMGGRSAIHYAAQGNHSEVVAALLDVAHQQPRPASVRAHVGHR